MYYILDANINWLVVIICLAVIFLLAFVVYFTDKTQFIKTAKDKKRDKIPEEKKDSDVDVFQKQESSLAENVNISSENVMKNISDNATNYEDDTIDISDLYFDNSSDKIDKKEEPTIQVVPDANNELLPEESLFDYPTGEIDIEEISAKIEHDIQKEDAIKEQMDLANDTQKFSTAEELALDDELGLTKPIVLKTKIEEENEKELSVDDIFDV